ncbi:hypothetical protein D3C87_1777420 [compost metagenome]
MKSESCRSSRRMTWPMARATAPSVAGKTGIHSSEKPAVFDRRTSKVTIFIWLSIRPSVTRCDSGLWK